MNPPVNRRSVLAAALLAPLAACSVPAPAAPATPVPVRDGRAGFVAMEGEFGARLGVFAIDTASGATTGHRADERFAFCSMFKGLAAAAVLDQVGLDGLAERVRFDAEALMASSFVTRDRVSTGMTLLELCDAAVRRSDGTAGNLLLDRIGGPPGLTAYARRLGDEVTRSDRIEPILAGAEPGDLRDTTSPRAWATAARRVLVDDALAPPERDHLVDLMVNSATPPSRTRIRAGLPAGWRVADKTGTGGYGTANNVAVAWPPGTPPLVLAVLSTREVDEAEPDDRLLARAAAHAVAVLRP